MALSFPFENADPPWIDDEPFIPMGPWPDARPALASAYQDALVVSAKLVKPAPLNVLPPTAQVQWRKSFLEETLEICDQALSRAEELLSRDILCQSTLRRHLVK